MSELRILSVCTNFPTRNRPTLGLFVYRRLSKLSGYGDLRLLVPQPYFPFLRPRPADALLAGNNMPVSIKRMFYLPGVAKSWDGGWLERVVSRWVSSMKDLDRGTTILDAHFGYPEGVGCYRVAKRLGVPLFITVRGLETELMEFPAIRKQMLEAFDYCTGVIAVSQSLKDMLVEQGLEAKKIRVISNGVDSDIYSPRDKLQSRQQLGVRIDAKLIVSLGNVQRRKGYDLLVEAIAPYRDTPSFRCVILGGVNETATMASLEARVAQLGMSDQVQFLGQATPDVVVQWLRAADAFVLPTRREGCCNAVLEALSSGVPVITTPAGDNTKFVVDGKNGFIVPHEDPRGLHRAIEQASEHPWDSRAISQSVHQYTWDGTAEKVHMFFQERLGRG
ncbi:MAG: glycosyltransferase [Pirellula sp.]|jgi:glycosyltransferase involved in cell wall biosynthesis|nr:glycosyltransferase [Pirellula sp.]